MQFYIYSCPALWIKWLYFFPDLVTKEKRVHQETSCAANVLVVPLPQIPVTMTTSYQHTNTPEETVYDTDFLHSDFSHGGITCDIMLNEQKTISNS